MKVKEEKIVEGKIAAGFHLEEADLPFFSIYYIFFD